VTRSLAPGFNALLTVLGLDPNAYPPYQQATPENIVYWCHSKREVASEPEMCGCAAWSVVTLLVAGLGWVGLGWAVRRCAFLVMEVSDEGKEPSGSGCVLGGAV
jgi:hypothetical protein